MNNEFKRLVDDRLSGLEWQQRQSNAVLSQIKGEVKVKKKLSLGLVLAIVLVLAAMTALAAALLWEQQVVPMKEIEQTEGIYKRWPVSQKQVLIRALVDSGHIEESSETKRLFDELTDEAEKHTIADQLLLTLIGQPNVNEISVDSITYAIMGPMNTWTPEQRVWWQQITEQFYGKAGAIDTLIVPTSDVISEAEAVAIGKAALLTAYELPADGLDKARAVADLYVTDQRPDYRRWNIQFQQFREGSDSYVERFYSVVVDEYGEVIADPDIDALLPEDYIEMVNKELSRPIPPLQAAYWEVSAKAEGRSFSWWPLELKAEYSRGLGTQVRAMMERGELSPIMTDDGDGLNIHLVAISNFHYGMPEEQDMEQSLAIDIAQKTLRETYDIDDNTFAHYADILPLFDVSDPTAPLWKFLFWPELESWELFDDYRPPLYKVEMNARTGEVVKTEMFLHEMMGDNFEYQLKLY